MVVEASPSAAFVVAQAKFLFEFEIVALDPPAQLGQVDHALERDVVWQRGESIVIGVVSALGPLDQQPLFRRRLASLGVFARRADPQPGKARGQRYVASFSPFDLLPGIGGELHCERFDRNRVVRRSASQTRGRPAAP